MPPYEKPKSGQEDGRRKTWSNAKALSSEVMKHRCEATPATRATVYIENGIFLHRLYSGHAS